MAVPRIAALKLLLKNKDSVNTFAQNQDPEELAKFSALAHRWWDPNSEFAPLHRINPLRLGWINERAVLSGKSALDVGCGGGILAEAMVACGRSEEHTSELQSH